MNSVLLTIVLMIPAVLIGFTFHEYAHAAVAYRLGDKTQAYQGRLTLNPLVHVDPIGFIMLLMFKIGWAKPVSVNTRAFKNIRRDDLLVTAAGPIANLLVAFIFAVIYGLFIRFVSISGIVISVIGSMIYLTIVINVNLFLFNLLPLPGLDGFRILSDLLPRAFNVIGEIAYRYQLIILLLLLSTGFAADIISVPSTAIQSILFNISGLIAF